MSSKMFKTGLAGRMRSWMEAQQALFTLQTLYDAMDAILPKSRDTIRLALRDFIRRSEVTTGERNRRQNASLFVYQGRPANTSPDGKVRQRVYKAMRLLSFKEPFAISDIRRMTGADRNYIDKLARKLLEDGHLKREGYRPRSSSYGKEAVYRVINTDRFRLEVME